jgi:hypothetical protein
MAFRRERSLFLIKYLTGKRKRVEQSKLLVCWFRQKEPCWFFIAILATEYLLLISSFLCAKSQKFKDKAWA